MGKKALRKDFYIEIKNTFGRFMSILLIVALGVAFFSGIRSTEPDMKLSGDSFYDRTNFMDIRVLSTMGLTEADLAALQGTEGINEAVGAYTADMLLVDTENQRVLKLYSYSNKINKPVLKEGRFPSNSQECLIDDGFLKLAGLHIGDTIALKSGDDTSIEDTLKNSEYMIVGSCSSPFYLSKNKGNSSIGNGTVDGFLILPEEAFALDVFTDVYLTVNGALEKNTYSDEYEDLIDSVAERIELTIQDERIQQRYDEIMTEATDELDDAKKKLTKEEKKAKKELAKAEKEITDGKKELADAEKEIEENEKKIADGKKELEKSEKELADGREALKKGKAQLDASKTSYWDGLEAYEEGKKNYDEGILELTQGKNELESQKAMLEYIEDPEQLAIAEETIKLAEGEIQKSEAELKAAKKTLDATKKQLDGAKKAIDQGDKQMAASERELTQGESALSEAKLELQEGEKEINDAKEEIKTAKKDLEDGEHEYLEGKAEAQEKIADAKIEIADAEEEIAKIELPEWYILDRGTIQTYVEYGQDAEKIGAIGKVFPVIFFLVAALVSLTTMTRMVEEQRIHIGTLKALGYSKRAIAFKYLMYALLASLAGSIIGGLAGGRLFPYVIITAYKMMYENLEVVVTPLIMSNFIMASAIAVICVVAATILACYKELAATPAQLMRPAAPKQGKRVFLEKIPFIWKHLNFTGKSTVRNLIRYKKRFFMTVFGIGGCMALMLVGYGVRDSISSVSDLQFGEIQIYDGIAALNQDAKAKDLRKAIEYVETNEVIKENSMLYETSVDAGKDEVEKSVSLTVLSDISKIGDYYNLRNLKTKEPIEFSEDSVIITEKLSQLLGVSVGDEIYLKKDEADKNTVIVGGIAENYLRHYIFMSPALYESIYSEEPDYNEIIYLTGELTDEEEDALTENLLKQKAIAGNSMTSHMGEDFEESMGNLDVVILILILSAGSLAFIVLYNLNNINITERRRELATIKVLGFYDLEVSEYVFRENILLTVIGIIFGIGFGIILHRYVILTAEIDMVMFGRQIAFMSFVKSALFTALFSFLINIAMHFKLKRIDMASSLKSVE